MLIEKQNDSPFLFGFSDVLSSLDKIIDYGSTYIILSTYKETCDPQVGKLKLTSHHKAMLESSFHIPPKRF